MLDFLKEVKVEAIIVSVLFIFVISILVLVYVERKMKKKLVKKVEEKDILIIDVDKLGISDEEPQVLLDKLDAIAKRFFENELKIPQSTDYSELTKMFGENNQPHLQKFAEKMTTLLYAGEKLDRQVILDLIFELESAVGKEREARRIKKMMLLEKNNPKKD